MQLQRGLEDLRDGDRFGSWIYRIARNAITDRHRAGGRTWEPLEGDEAASVDEGADSSLGLTACVAPFVARLASPYREAVTLVDLEGVAQAEAARMLGVSLSGLKSRVQRGRAKLRAMFDECCQLDIDARGRVMDYECRSEREPGGCCSG